MTWNSGLRGPDITIGALGEIARRILKDHEAGAVLAVFRRSFYIRFGDDVVCVGSRGLGQGPLNLLATIPGDLTWPDTGLAPGRPVVRAGTILSIEGRLRFDLREAQPWQPPAARVPAPADLQAGLDLLAMSAARRRPGGLGVVLERLGGSFAPLETAEDPLLRAASGTMIAIRQWMQAALAGAADAPPAVASLVGLGPGLTPSGDDFFCGAMTALHHLGEPVLARRLAAVVLPVAERDTSLISFAYLRCAAQGHASAVLFDALDSVFRGGDALEARLDAVHAVGHTSGWDSLVGAATACAAWMAARGSVRGG